MDAVRMLEILMMQFIKDKDGLDIKMKELFSKIVFGNLLS
jgi:hypothetical protein